MYSQHPASGPEVSIPYQRSKQKEIYPQGIKPHKDTNDRERVTGVTECVYECKCADTPAPQNHMCAPLGWGEEEGRHTGEMGYKRE